MKRLAMKRLVCSIALVLIFLSGQQFVSAQATALRPAAPHKHSDLLYRLNSQVATIINQAIKLPRPLVLTSRACGGVNAFYNPASGVYASTTTMCAELVDDIIEEFQYDGLSQDQLNEAIWASLFFTLYHELGHALIDILDLPTTGREEDAVDQLATLLLNSAPEAAFWAAEYWRQKDDFGDTGLGKRLNRLLQRALGQNLYADEHSLDEQRFYNILCWTYGADPQNRQYLLRSLPSGRAERCPGEYRRMASAWERHLEGHLRVGQQPQQAQPLQQPQPLPRATPPRAPTPSERPTIYVLTMDESRQLSRDFLETLDDTAEAWLRGERIIVPNVPWTARTGKPCLVVTFRATGRAVTVEVRYAELRGASYVDTWRKERAVAVARFDAPEIKDTLEDLLNRFLYEKGFYN